MLIAVLLFVLGLVLLLKGGDWFVDGATGLACRFRVPELIVGATVVSVGTTLPEVMVSAASAIGGRGEIAYGNAIGSIICNTSLIAAITIAAKPAPVDAKALKLPVAFFFLSAAIYCAAAYLTGYFCRWLGFVLLGVFAVYMILSVRQGVQSHEADPEDKAVEQRRSLGAELFFLALGAVLIAVGADLLVENGTVIAEKLGVPESVIALTFVALGTSLPELVTAVTSLAKGHGALSLGNIIGANIFNLVLVSGIAVSLAPFAIPNTGTLFGKNASLVLDIPVMLAAMSLLSVPALIRKKLSRGQGILLLSLYAAFCAIQFTM